MKKLEVHKTIVIHKPVHDVWSVIVSPDRMKDWMLVAPEIDDAPIELGSKVKWLDESGTPYLTGTVTVFRPHSRLVLELDDVSWTRPARPGEVTYALTLSEHQDGTEIDFVLGDLSIDAEARQWHDAYAASHELESIKSMAETS